MRQPTTETEALAWHREAMRLKDMHLPFTVVNDDPQPGWYLCKAVKGGPMLPARIWIDQDVDDANELLDHEYLRCQVVFNEKDPWDFWSHLAKNPISQTEHDRLIELGDWASEWDPKHPFNEPYKPIAARDIPMPTFGGQ